MPVPLPDELLDLLGRPSLCFVATIMPDGSPQLTQTWVTTDGEHILINTPDHSQKARNAARDPRVAVNVVDPGNTRRYFAVRGRVIATTTEGGAQSIDEISGKYLGRPYPNFSGRPETRMIMTIRIVRQEPVVTTERNASEGPVDKRIAVHERTVIDAISGTARTQIAQDTDREPIATQCCMLSRCTLVASPTPTGCRRRTSGHLARQASCRGLRESGHLL